MYGLYRSVGGTTQSRNIGHGIKGVDLNSRKLLPISDHQVLFPTHKIAKYVKRAIHPDEELELRLGPTRIDISRDIAEELDEITDIPPIKLIKDSILRVPKIHVPKTHRLIMHTRIHEYTSLEVFMEILEKNVGIIMATKLIRESDDYLILACHVVTMSL